MLETEAVVEAVALVLLAQMGRRVLEALVELERILQLLDLTQLMQAVVVEVCGTTYREALVEPVVVVLVQEQVVQVALEQLIPVVVVAVMVAVVLVDQVDRAL